LAHKLPLKKPQDSTAITGGMSAFAPKADKKQTATVCPLSANKRPEQVQQRE
jgi:hypothetical protein